MLKIEDSKFFGQVLNTVLFQATSLVLVGKNYGCSITKREKSRSFVLLIQIYPNVQLLLLQTDETSSKYICSPNI